MGGGARPDFQAIDFQRSPFIVIWELTRACALACVHCRAEAVPRRDARELTTAEGLGLIETVASFGPPAPLLVFTGGDPLRRPDAFDLVAAGTERGLRVALTPSGTAAARREKIFRLNASGLARLAVSLDGSEATIHDAFRGVRGSFDWTMRILEYAREAELPIQINTTVTRYNRTDLPAMAERLMHLGIVLWSFFFLVPTGRGRPEDGVSAQDYRGDPERPVRPLLARSLRDQDDGGAALPTGGAGTAAGDPVGRESRDQGTGAGGRGRAAAGVRVSGGHDRSRRYGGQ